MGERIRVVLVDDHPMFREAVAMVLAADGDVEVVGEGGTAAEAIELAETLLPDVLVLDLNMPGGGIEAARDVRARVPGTRVVVLTVSEDEGDVFSAMDAGVLGYIVKGSSAHDLKSAVLAAHAGLTSGLVR